MNKYRDPQRDILERVKYFRALSLKWDFTLKSQPSRFREPWKRRSRKSSKSRMGWRHQENMALLNQHGQISCEVTDWGSSIQRACVCLHQVLCIGYDFQFNVPRRFLSMGTSWSLIYLPSHVLFSFCLTCPTHMW